MMPSNDTVMTRLAREVLSTGNFDLAPQLVADDVVDHSGAPDQAPGLAGMIERWRALRTAFPDFQIEVEHIVEDGDVVAMRAVGRGTHRGPFFGIAPTGRRVEFAEISMNRIADGKLVEHWAQRSNLEVLLQLGVTLVPPDP